MRRGKQLVDPRINPETAAYRIGDAVDFFCRERRLEGLTESTASWYRRRLKGCLGDYYDLDVRILNDEFLEQLRLGLLSRVGDGWSMETANGHIGALKAFVYWLLESPGRHLAGVEVHPRLIKKGKADAKVPVHLTIEEVGRLLSTYDEKDVLQLRDKCLTALMLDTGLRVGEALSLRISDIERASNVIVIRHAKSRRDRTVRMSDDMAALMARWLQVRNQQPREVGEYLFPSNERPQLSQEWYNTIIHRHATDAGITKKVSAHTLRHTFAVAVINSPGSDAAVLQKALGHAHIAMALHYGRMYDSTVHQQSVQASPLTQIANANSEGGGMVGLRRTKRGRKPRVVDE